MKRWREAYVRLAFDYPCRSSEKKRYTWEADMSDVFVASYGSYATEKAAVAAARRFLGKHFPGREIIVVEDG
jgi:hypothetical protein